MTIPVFFESVKIGRYPVKVKKDLSGGPISDEENRLQFGGSHIH
jgi:hypothetical protein